MICNCPTCGDRRFVYNDYLCTNEPCKCTYPEPFIEPRDYPDRNDYSISDETRRRTVEIQIMLTNLSRRHHG